MTAVVVRPDNSIPLILGHVYLLTPSMGGNYLRIDAVTDTAVHFTGVDSTIADFWIPIWKADDILVKDMGATIIPGAGNFLLFLNSNNVTYLAGGHVELLN